MPVRVAVTAGTTADCTQAAALIDGIAAQFLLADRGYDSNEILDKAVQAGCEAVIPPRRNRKNNAIMIRIFTECAIWWKMPFFTLSAGGV